MTMTTNQPSVVNGDAFTVTRTVHISAPVEKVWAAITQPEHLVKWFAPVTTLDGSGVGATGAFTFDERSIPVRIEEVDPMNAIAYRWANDDSNPVQDAVLADSHSVIMRFTLVADAGGTTLTVVESGFETSLDPSLNLSEHQHGWDIMLDQAADYLEGRR
jgi:uncharacterized protein YndB with AHSA1/START domain